MYNKNMKHRKPALAGIGVILLVLCLFFLFSIRGRTVQLRSDAAGIEFMTEGEIITCVTVLGQFPYLSVVSKTADGYSTDSAGNITEVYTLEAKFSLNHRNSMKLYIETPEEVTHTYILKFADKDVVISNGKVVE